MIIDSDYNRDFWDTLKYTFVAFCKCQYCQKEFHGRFADAIHEHIECPGCRRSLSWWER